MRGIIADVDVKQKALEMVRRMRGGDVGALARAVSIVEDRRPGWVELLQACEDFARKAMRIGVTGPPGAGKSTLVDQMARWLRDQGKTVGIVAVDPTSPYTGGALLGDRIRMNGFADDAGVYVRSMASRGVLGGLAGGVADVCRVLEAAGCEMILIETVGVGQDEVAIAGLADVTVVVLVPGMGDGVQSLKAGMMEVADVFVVNKADTEGAERVEGEILAMQGLVAAEGWVAPVVRTVALSGDGVGELMGMVSIAMKSPRPKVLIRGSRGLVMDHLGLAVKSIAAARGFYEALGIVVGVEETVEHEQVKTVMLPLGESRIELLEATAEDSVIGRFVAKRGEGMHHVAMRVESVDAMFEELKARGTRLVSDAVRVGAGGHRYFFVHPASTGGVLMEIVGE